MVVRKAGATEWLNSSGNIGGVFTVVASSGGDYETVSAALAAGASDIYIQTDITETADGTFSDDTRIWLAPKITWDLDGNTFTGAASIDIEIIGAPGATLEYTRTTTTQPFTGVSTTKYTFRELTWINNSSSNSSSIVTNSLDQEYYNIEFSPGGVNLGGINASLNSDTIISGAIINSEVGSSSCINLDAPAHVSDVLIRGDCPTNGIILSFNGGGTERGTVSGLKIIPDNAGGTTRLVNFIGAYAISDVFIDEECVIQTATSTLLSNISAEDSYIAPGGFTSITATNCRFKDYLAGVPFPGALDLSNCQFADQLTTAGDGDNYVNCTFDSGLIVDSDDVTVIGCTTGDLSGGGATTITLNSGVQRPTVLGCRTDVAVVDSGAASPQITANQVY